MAAQLSKEEIDQFKSVFDIFDKDGTAPADGKGPAAQRLAQRVGWRGPVPADSMAMYSDITAEELGDVMKSLGLNPSKAELQDIVNEADLNKDGVINFEEFLSLMSQTVKETDTEEELMNAFRVFDKDNSGTISSDELRNVLKSLGENLTDAELDEMIKLADKNGDGTIDYHEFAQIMK